MSLTKADLQAIGQITIEVAEGVVITAINDLAIKVVEGFNEMSSRLDRVEAALKVDVAMLKTDVDTVGRSEPNGLQYLEEQIERIRHANSGYNEPPRTNAR